MDNWRQTVRSYEILAVWCAKRSVRNFDQGKIGSAIRLLKISCFYRTKIDVLKGLTDG